tara:strand:+ start:1338 stop:1589 length:252 start_codon:yes stop_codon:yes gene_type:complete
MPWNWQYVSQNPNITWEIIMDNLDKPWDLLNLYQNSSVRESSIDQLRLKMIKSNIIKRYWKKYTWDPKYPYAQKMILKRAELS